MLKPDAVVPFLGKQLDIAEDFVRLIDDSRKNNEKVFCSNLLELVRKFSIEGDIFHKAKHASTKRIHHFLVIFFSEENSEHRLIKIKNIN